MMKKEAEKVEDGQLRKAYACTVMSWAHKASKGSFSEWAV